MLSRLDPIRRHCLLLWPACAAAVFSGCATNESDGKNLAALRRVYGPEAPSGIQDTVETPPHTMSRSDYPFDSRGNYREEWVTVPTRTSPQTPRAPSVVPSRGSSGASVASGASRGTTVHVVKKGDTLYGISRRYGVTLYSLRQINNLKSYTIRPGQRLRIPPR